MGIDLVDPAIELIRLCSCVLSDDVRKGLEEARAKEEPGSMSANAFGSLLENVEVAREKSYPMCQDTGAAIFWIDYPGGTSQMEIESQLTEAVRQASRIPYLRPNAVCSLTGKNSGDNTGAGVPIFHCHEWDRDHLRVRMMLKGGGSENVSAQYRLPDARLKGGRNLEGVRRCVIDAVQAAQGKGCAPGCIGVGIGGNRDTGFEAGKLALMRKFDQKHPDPQLAELEERLLGEINELGIGPMGFGGRTTALTVKIDARHRLPACFFVSVAYTCWALRRHTMTISGSEVSYD